MRKTSFFDTCELALQDHKTLYQIRQKASLEDFKKLQRIAHLTRRDNNDIIKRVTIHTISLLKSVVNIKTGSRKQLPQERRS